MRKWRLKAMFGNGIKTMALGPMTTWCLNQGAMNVAIFLDDVNQFNGPIMFFPGSQKRRVLKAGHDLTTTSYPLWTIDNQLIRQLGERAGGREGWIVSLQGPGGSMILFHGFLVHSSTSNFSPWNRFSVYLSLIAVSNHIRRFKGPEYISHRDFTPMIVCFQIIRWNYLGGMVCPILPGKPLRKRFWLESN